MTQQTKSWTYTVCTETFRSDVRPFLVRLGREARCVAAYLTNGLGLEAGT